MRKPKATAFSVVDKWAHDLREAAEELEEQARRLRRSADDMQSKPVKGREVFSGLMKDRDGDAVIHP